MVQKYSEKNRNLLLLSCLLLSDNYEQLDNRVFYYFSEFFFNINIVSIEF